MVLPPSNVNAAFIGHGAPTLAIDAAKGAPLAEWGREMKRPRAILVVSAHWETNEAALGATTGPLKTIHDFSGFPPALSEVRYPAPGAPEIAREVEALLGGPLRRDETRGLDHGVWTPLVHMFPDADVPVLQLSLSGTPRDVFSRGEKLAALSDVLLLGTGSLTHNLQQIGRDGSPPPAWATEFDAWCADCLEKKDFDALIDFRARAPHATVAQPSDEHFVPLLFAAGAGSRFASLRFPVVGFEYGSISRRSVEFS